MAEYATRIRCPFRIIKAKDSSAFEPERTWNSIFELYKKKIKDFQVVEVAGSDHVHLVNPENIAPSLEDFFFSQ